MNKLIQRCQILYNLFIIISDVNSDDQKRNPSNFQKCKHDSNPCYTIIYCISRLRFVSGFNNWISVDLGYKSTTYIGHSTTGFLSYQKKKKNTRLISLNLGYRGTTYI